jgi:nucleotide-binding universal stress UspA family protein
MQKKILVAVDESAASVEAAHFIEKFFAGMPVEILAVNVAPGAVQWLTPVTGFGGVTPWAYPASLSPEDLTRIRDDERAVAAETLTEVAPANADTLVQFGDPVLAILDAAREHHADLIAVGTHHKNMFARLIQGSVSEDLVRRSPVPVLVVPAPDGHPASVEA